MVGDKTFQEKIYAACAKKSPQVIPLFKYLHLAIILFLLIGAYSTISQNSWFAFFYQTGINLGRVAITLLGVVVLPGILGRFGVEIRLTRIITLFRRQLGITVFLLAFTHYNLVRGIPRLVGIYPLKPPFPLFETIGILALSLLFLMFLTSNNFSVRRLGKWWKRLHRVVYVVLWLLVLHTGLQRISIWTYLIGAMATLEIASLIYYFAKQNFAYFLKASAKTPETKKS